MNATLGKFLQTVIPLLVLGAAGQLGLAGRLWRSVPGVRDRGSDDSDHARVPSAPSAARDGHVNLSPKGMETLIVRDDRRISWLNLSGSGNETAAHLREDPRMTLMFCAFEGDPLIVRAYGTARATHPHDRFITVFTMHNDLSDHTVVIG